MMPRSRRGGCGAHSAPSCGTLDADAAALEAKAIFKAQQVYGWRYDPRELGGAARTQERPERPQNVRRCVDRTMTQIWENLGMYMPTARSGCIYM